MKVIYVRRGEFSTYNVLIDSLMAVNDVDIRWDRRTGDDRRARPRPIEVRPRPIEVKSDRRSADRRRLPTRDWQLHGYTVVDFQVDTPPSSN